MVNGVPLTASDGQADEPDSTNTGGRTAHVLKSIRQIPAQEVVFRDEDSETQLAKGTFLGFEVFYLTETTSTTDVDRDYAYSCMPDGLSFQEIHLTRYFPEAVDETTYVITSSGRMAA